MPRYSKALPGPSKLSVVLSNLNRQPKAALPSLKSLAITFAAKNDHFGARHFVKEDLPRIRFANPELPIQINKIPKSPEDKWKAELSLELKDGKTRTLDVSNRMSSAIFEELMEIGGGERWRRYKQETETNDDGARSTVS